MIRSIRIRHPVSLFSSRQIPLLIFGVTFVAFSSALWNGFVEWDDTVNLLNNSHYRGLGWEQLRWMFTTALMEHYIPLTWVTFGLDYLLWGMNPLGYHLTNLLLHSANAVLFYSVALRLLRLATTGLEETTLRLGAGAAALFFAVHPLRVESVAWVTERRDVLSGLFFLLTILTYLKACQAGGAWRLRWLTGSVGCYVLALASKSIVMTLPLILLLLDIYPLRRLSGRWQEWTSPSARRIWAEKTPYLLLALAGGGSALYAVSAKLTPLTQYPLPARLAMTVYSLWFYLWKTLFPLALSPLYQLPARVNPLDPPFLVSAIAVGSITGALFLMRRTWPAGLAVWVGYGVILAPVSGLVHQGPQLTSDRDSYLSCLGWALLVGAGVCAVIRAQASGKLRRSFARLAAGAVVVWFIGLAALTWQQVQVWRDSETLWRHAITIDPDCRLCYYNLALALNWYNLADIVKTQGAERAVEHFRRLVALEHFQRALERYPDDVNVLNNLGATLIEQGRPEEALQHLQRVIRLNPTHIPARYNLGTALILLGRPAEALERFRQAAALNPDAPELRLGLARAYLALGDIPAAEGEYEILKRLDPGLASRLSSMGLKR